ncbi:WD40 repeat domain-containing protein [Sorangium sp. So ce385]|uniref:WD40 repeat domain-containing protein n=1 Tax=Sorangium sp. So ce385 TaxID=3133308 RepID=UPI003F5C8980
MSQPEEVVAIELVLAGATESPAPLHRSGFYRIAVDGVGARALTFGGALDRAANVIAWDLGTGQRIEGAWIVLHPDGRRGLRAEPDDTVAFCDIASGERLSVLDGLDATFAPAELASDRYALLCRSTEAADDDRPAPSVKVIDLATGKRIHDLEQPHLLGAYLPGDRGLFVDPRGMPSIWDLAGGKLMARLKGPAERPIRLRVARDGKTAITIGKKGTTCSWDLDGRKLSWASDSMHEEYGGGARDYFELLPDGRRAVYTSRPGVYGNHFLGFMDLTSGALDQSWTTADEERAITAVCPFPDSPHLALLIERTTSSPATVEIWDTGSRLLVGAREVRSAKVLAVTADKRVVVGGSRMGGPDFFRVYEAAQRPGAPLPAQPPPGAPAAPEEAPEETPAAEAPPPKKPRRKPAKK